MATKHLPVYLKTEQYDGLKKRADAAGLSMSRFVQRVLFSPEAPADHQPILLPTSLVARIAELAKADERSAEVWLRRFLTEKLMTPAPEPTAPPVNTTKPPSPFSIRRKE